MVAGAQRIIFVGLVWRWDAAVDFVGGNMEKVRRLLGARRFEHRECPTQVGLEHGSRRQNAAIHMRLGSEIGRSHPAASPRWSGSPSAASQMSPCTEAVARVLCHRRARVFQIARVGQLVEVHYRRRLLRCCPSGPSSSRTNALPMKPAPPVTKNLICAAVPNRRRWRPGHARMRPFVLRDCTRRLVT